MVIFVDEPERIDTIEMGLLLSSSQILASSDPAASGSASAGSPWAFLPSGETENMPAGPGMVLPGAVSSCRPFGRGGVTKTGSVSAMALMSDRESLCVGCFCARAAKSSRLDQREQTHTVIWLIKSAIVASSFSSELLLINALQN